ncbi:hypothetical protein [Gracilibacillus xinjiangensis]|uniref:Uncharacterized protein n=1 Tax=Gracilibacillus xinjiangensis TaxID=1193282 RepID=A0ABV8WTI2_9BACI
MQSSIQQNAKQQSAFHQKINGEIGISADLPYLKEYKYGDYIYSNIRWNTINLQTNNANNMQINFQPIWGSLGNYTDPYGNRGTLIKSQSGIFTLKARYQSYKTTSPYAIVNTVPIVEISNRRFIPISISYAGIGTTINIPLNNVNSSKDGQIARWDLDDIDIPLTNSSGDLDNYMVEGMSYVTGDNANVQIQTGIYVKIAAMYSFSDMPVQLVTLTDSYAHDYIYAKTN